MATYDLVGFPPGAFDSVSGGGLESVSGQFRLDPDFDVDTDRYDFEITDDDTGFQGDLDQNESGDDTSQDGVVRNAAGSTIGSGRIYLEQRYTFTDEFGGTVNVYRVEIGGTHVGYLADGPIQPGNTYTTTASNNVTNADHPNYSAFDNTTYDPDDANDITGTSNADSLEAGSSADTVDGGDGNDTIFGGSGNDSIDGGAGNDSIVGGDGDDTISGGTGVDTLYGDGDQDTFIVEDGFGNDTIFGGEGGTDDDTIDLSALTGPVTVTYTGDEAGTITDGTDTLTFSEIENIFLTQFDDSVDGGADSVGINIFADDGEDTVTGGTGDDSLDGGGDNDTLFGGDGADTIRGGDGDDSIGGYSGTDLGDDEMYGDAGDDRIIGGAGNDTIYGGTGQDTLSGAEGTDYLYGEDDQDQFWITDNHETTHAVGGEGGTDNDQIWFSNFSSTQGLTVTFSGTGAGSFDFVGTSGAGTFSEIEGIGGTVYADVIDASLDAGGTFISGQAGSDTITGGTGDDTIDAGDDGDTIIFQDGFGDDVIAGGEGGVDDDTIDLTALTGPVTVTYTGDEAGTIANGTDTVTFSEIENIFLTDFADVLDGTNDTSGLNIDAGDGDNTVTGGSGADSLVGGDGADSFLGGAGDDTLQGWDGDDSLQGGAGSDSLQGGAGLDIADYSGSDAGVTIDLTNGVATGGHATGDTLVGMDGITGSDFGDSLTGFDGSGADYTNVIDGGAGNDTIDGKGSGDTLIGGTGDDSIIGGTGDDTISGGDGDDIFVYTVGDGHDTITDFNTGNTGTLIDGNSGNNDFIDLSGFYDNLSELYADQADDGILNQSNTTDSKGRSTDYSDNDQFGAGSIRMQGASGDNTSFTEENTGVVCFTTGTAIRTPHGDVLIDDLKVGDLVTTMDNGPQRIRWIGRRVLAAAELTSNSNLRPVLIKKGVLGSERNLLVSPQHGMLIDDNLVRAKHLAVKPGIRIASGKRTVTYIHLMFDAHQIIFAESIPAESFYPGPMALSAAGELETHELLGFIPKLCGVKTYEDARQIYGITARKFAKRRSIVWPQINS